MARPVTIRGVQYPSQKAAAAALGISENSLSVARRVGRLDRCGLGLVGPIPAPVRVRGEIFPSVKAAAAALGVSKKAIYQAIERGGEDRVGLPRALLKNPRSKPIAIGGLQFPSMAAASRALGFGSSYIAKSFANDRRKSLEKILGAAMAESARRAKLAQNQSESTSGAM